MSDSDDEPMCAPTPPPPRLPSGLKLTQLTQTTRTLSSHALDALKEFYTERDARAKQFEELQAEAEERAKAGTEGAAVSGAASGLKYPLSMETFGEDWNESQFWVRELIRFNKVFGGTTRRR